MAKNKIWKLFRVKFIVALVIGIVLGFGSIYLLGSQTKIEIIGDQRVIVSDVSSYVDEGCSFTLFGLDLGFISESSIEVIDENTIVITYSFKFNILSEIETTRVVVKGAN